MACPDAGVIAGARWACPCRGTALEEQLETELKLPFVDAFTCQAVDSGYCHKVAGIGDHSGDRIEGGGISQTIIGSGEVGVIGEVERVHSELEPQSLRQVKVALNREVVVDDSRSTQDVEARGAQARRVRIRKGEGIIVVFARTNRAYFGYIGLDLIGGLVAARSIEAGPVRIN